MAYKIKSKKKGTEYRLSGQEYNLNTGKKMGEEHSIIIDTGEKDIFYKAKNEEDVKKRFYNHPYWKSHPTEKLRLIITKIEKIK